MKHEGYTAHDFFIAMNPFVIINTLSILTIVGQVLAVCLISILVLCLFKNTFGLSMRRFIADYGILSMFIVALIATSGSLFFSEIALFAPCKDCWFQRIFMYPQVIVLAIALWRKDRNIAWYILALSVIGLIISGDQYGDQWAAILNPVEYDPLQPCDLSGVSCSATYIFEYGYITIPLMAGTAFCLNTLGSICMLLDYRSR